MDIGCQDRIFGNLGSHFNDKLNSKPELRCKPNMSSFLAVVGNILPETSEFLRTILANEDLPNDYEDIFSFLPKIIKSGTDNCAAHHICNDIFMFTGELRKRVNIGIRCVVEEQPL